MVSSYLTSGLIKWRRCKRALSGQYSKSGTFPYNVCQSMMKRGSDICKTPRLNAEKFEKVIVEELRANILTESNIRDQVKIVDEEMNEVASEQRQTMETIESELADVRRRLGRLWDIVETTDDVPTDTDVRIKANTERRSLLEASLKEAQSIISQRRSVLDDVEAMVARAQNMGELLNESELTETRAFVHSFVKEIVVMPDNAVVRYTIPIPQSTREAQALLVS